MIDHKNNCLTCSNPTVNRKYCSNTCQKDFEYRTFINEWLSGRVDGTISGSCSHRIKRYLREKHGNKCADCGWNRVNPTTGKVPLEVEHIDGKWTNNKPENLKLICPNCHSLTSSYRALNVGNAVERKHRPRKTPS